MKNAAYLCQILAVLGTNQQVLQFLQGTTGTSLEVNLDGVLSGTLAIFALLQHGGEAFLIGSGHNTNGLLVHNTAVTVWADAGQIVGFLSRKYRVVKHLQDLNTTYAEFNIVRLELLSCCIQISLWKYLNWKHHWTRRRVRTMLIPLTVLKGFFTSRFFNKKALLLRMINQLRWEEVAIVRLEA